MADVPEGFYALPLDSGFMKPNGPLYGRRTAGRITVGLRVEKHHCNGAGVCHGGMLATVADMLLGWGALDAAGHKRLGSTVTLSVDYLSHAALGSWIAGVAEVLHASPNLVFAQTVIRMADTPVLRASGVYRVAREDDKAWDLHKWFPPDR